MTSNESNKKSITLDGMTPVNLLFILFAICMLITGIYLTNHFFDVNFPVNMGGASSACDMNSFLNCDAATTSSLSQIAGVPISFFSILLSIFFLFSIIFPSEGNEKTIKFILILNVIGCLGLFIYSLAVLGSLCPFCTFYYILSFASLFIFFKYSDYSPQPAVKNLISVGVLFLVSSYFVRSHYQDKERKQIGVVKAQIKDFFSNTNLGDPLVESPYKINKATENFADGKIRISVFSDFQCPFCKLLNDQIHRIVRKYKDVVNVQYFFYPLDNACNSKIKNSFHQFACKGAYLAACDESKFLGIHDEIFDNQKNLNNDFLVSLAKENGVESCLNDQSVKDKVVKLINVGDQFNIKSTPTLIINGVKIEGSVPIPTYFALFEEILKRAQK